MLVAANKCDIAAPEQIEEFRAFVEDQGYSFFAISAAARQGTEELVKAVAQRLQTLPPIKEYQPEPVDRERLLGNPLQGEDRFLWFGVNARFFNIQDSDDMIMDTLGLFAIGLPDVQLHFRDMDPNPLSSYLYNVAQYLYDNDCPIKSGETIDGVGPDGSISRELQWTCAYEHSLLQPARDVLDICPGPFAAGRRSGKDKKGNFYK